MLHIHKIAFGVIFTFLLLFTGCQTQHDFSGTELSAPHPAPDITLNSVDGPVNLHDFKGKYTFVYFGYVFCPDVCPSTMSMLTRVKKGLGEDANQIEVIMVTLDPERDTPEKLAEYMNYFDSSFIGLSGDMETIDQLREPFGIYYQRQEGSVATGYLIDHSARFYLLDRDTNAIVAYPHGTLSDVVIKDITYLIKQDS